MLLDEWAPDPDASEVHAITIAAPEETVYRALWTTDFADTYVVKSLLALRSLPAALTGGRKPSPNAITLKSVVDAGFGRLAEDPGREIVLGVSGRFWRPTGNLEPFDLESFSRPVAPGMARAAWSFRVTPGPDGRTILSTETRVTCGDGASRAKFLAYWTVIRPFSGLIRILMLKAIKRTAER